MNIAVILAGGTGSRINNTIPKQFMVINGRAILEYCVDVFENHQLIDKIIIVVKSEYISKVKALAEQNQYKKILKIVTGGRERYESSIAAIKTCESDNDILLFHDCARPMVSERIITDCIYSMSNYDAATVAIKTSDTIYEYSNGVITSIPPRSTLLNAQTPQCFKAHIIKSAYHKALNDPEFQPTDDCSVVFRYLPEIPIHIVEGEPSNIKITYKSDLEILSNFLESRNSN